MFRQNFSSIPVFSDMNQLKTTPKKSKSAEKLRTTIERQKNSRYKVLSNRRFPNRSTEWGNDSDNGYDSDESSDSHSSTIGSEHISQTDILRALFACQPLPQWQTTLNKVVSVVLAQMDSHGYDFDAISDMVDHFFTAQVLNKMSTFIGSECIRLSIQIRILKMFEEMVDKLQLSDEWIHNLINSSMVPKLIEVLVSGNKILVEGSLDLLLLILQNNTSTLLLTNFLNCGLIEVMIARADLIRWKTTKANSLDLRANRRQSLSQNSFSETAKDLSLYYARGLFRVLGFDMEDSLRMALLTKVTPLLSRYMTCPDINVITVAINCIGMLTISQNQSICSVIVQRFGQSLFAMTDRNEEAILFSVLQSFRNMMSSSPHLFIYQDFGLNLIRCLDKIVAKNNQRLVKEIIEIIEIICNWIVINMETTRQLSYRLLCLSLVVFKSGDRYNRIIALQNTETLLRKYSYESFAYLLGSFDIRGLISQLLSNDNHQKTGLEIVAHILNILSDSFDFMPEEVERVKHLLFGKTTDIYFCLEKLSFKTCNDFVSNRANHLLKEIDGKLTNDEDISLLPKVNQNGFVFDF